MKKKNSLDSARNYISLKWKGFIDSFRNLDRRILLVVLYNLAFMLAAFFLFSSFRKVIISESEPVLSLNINSATLKSAELLAKHSGIINNFYHTIIAYIVLFAAVLFLAYAVSNLLIWTAITGKKLKKLTVKFSARFILMNLIWTACWAVFGLIITSSMRQEKVLQWLLIFTLVYMHFTTLMYMAYFKRGKLKRALKQPFRTGISKIQEFIVPYALAAAFFALLNLIFKPFQMLPEKGMVFAATVGSLFYFAWLRIYVYSFAKELV